jgi:hypothetical protein
VLGLDVDNRFLSLIQDDIDPAGRLVDMLDYPVAVSGCDFVTDGEDLPKVARSSWMKSANFRLKLR